MRAIRMLYKLNKNGAKFNYNQNEMCWCCSVWPSSSQVDPPVSEGDVLGILLKVPPSAVTGTSLVWRTDNDWRTNNCETLWAKWFWPSRTWSNLHENLNANMFSACGVPKGISGGNETRMDWDMRVVPLSGMVGPEFLNKSLRLMSVSYISTNQTQNPSVWN